MGECHAVGVRLHRDSHPRRKLRLVPQMILRSIVILVVMGTGTAFALDHPRLPHRVLHVISPAQLEATCPGTFACAIVYWGKRTCHVYVPNAHLPGWPSRRQLLAHEFRHCNGRGQD